MINEHELPRLGHGPIHFVITLDSLSVGTVPLGEAVPRRHGHQDDFALGIRLSDGINHGFQIDPGDFDGALEMLDAVVDCKLDEDGVRMLAEDSFLQIGHAPSRPSAGSAAVNDS